MTRLISILFIFYFISRTAIASGRSMDADKENLAIEYRKSAEKGNAGAQNNLGAMYYKGQGVQQSDIEAIN